MYTARRVLRRPRLDGELDRIFDFSAGEVTGPPGSGKTTWLRSWSENTQSADVTWFTVQPRHQDVLVLARDLLDEVRRATSTSAPAGEVRAGDLVDELTGSSDATGRRVVIVDEVEVLADAEACGLLRELIVHGEDSYRVVVAGRAVPDIGLQALRRSGELVFFTAADLRLTGPETAELVRSNMRSEPSEHDLAAIHEQTDGWALGAVLAGLVLDHAGDAPRAVSEGLGGHHYFDQFFGSEVFGALPDDVRNFLLDTCVLPLLEPELCAELSGRDDALALLRRLEHDNVFIEWMGGRPPIFRYHALLRAWLLGHLKAHDPRRLTALTRRAAMWYETRSRMADAIEHRLAAEDFEAAASLIVDYGPGALGEGRYGAVRTWIGALPKALVSSNGPLLILLGEAEHRLGDAAATGAARALARDLVARRSDHPPFANAEATIAVQRGTSLHRMGWLETAADHGRRALSAIDLTPRRSGEEEVRFDDLLVAMDVASIASQLLFTGELTESARLSRWVADNFPADDRNVAAARLRCLGQAAVAELLIGARPIAEALAREAQAICRLHELDPVEVGYAEMVLLVTGSESEQQTLDAALRRRTDQVALRSHTCLAGLMRSWSNVRTGDLAAAREALDEAVQELDSLPEPGMLASFERRVRAMVESGADEPPLGERDRQVLAVLARSGSRRAAADELHLSLNTVKTYARRIYRALGVGTLADALDRCAALGIELPDHLEVTSDNDAAVPHEPS